MPAGRQVQAGAKRQRRSVAQEVTQILSDALAERYEQLLTLGRGIRMVDVTRDQLRAAAQLRAATGARTPDALHLVSALSTGCKAFLTNDRRLPAVPGLRVIQLSSYVSATAD